MAELPIPKVTYQVFPDVPAPLQNLMDLANNFWWVWHPEAVELFRRLDREQWEKAYHNPVKLLGTIDQKKLAAAAKDDGDVAQLKRVYEHFRAHIDGKGWYATQHGDKARLRVAYFSAEFGVHESLPIYSGGLGILAGDHLKSASDLGIPLVSVGLFYGQGYFQQHLDEQGWQQETYTDLKISKLPMEPALSADGKPEPTSA